jgi:putative transposase
VAGGVYHVYARGNRQEPLFLDDADRRQYLLLWGAVAEHLGWRSLAFCLMDNHVHHVVETPEPDLDSGVQMAHGGYARYFNDAHGKSGHVFQGRYGSTLAKTSGALWYLTAYVVLNPVRAGMCGQPEEHGWSSHAAMVGRRRPPAWLDIGRLLSFYEPPGVESYRRVVDGVRLLGTGGFDPPLSRLD